MRRSFQNVHWNLFDHVARGKHLVEEDLIQLGFKTGVLERCWMVKKAIYGISSFWVSKGYHDPSHRGAWPTRKLLLLNWMENITDKRKQEKECLNLVDRVKVIRLKWNSIHLLCPTLIFQIVQLNANWSMRQTVVKKYQADLIFIWCFVNQRYYP